MNFAWNPFSVLTSKIFGALLIVSLITLGPALWITRGKLIDARETIAGLRSWQSELVDAIRLAAENPDVDSKTAKAQVQSLGYVRIKLTSAIKSQNEAIDALQEQSEQAMAAAREAERKRRAAVQQSKALQAELRRRAGFPVPADQLEAEIRRSQDQVYEAGL